MKWKAHALSHLLVRKGQLILDLAQAPRDVNAAVGLALLVEDDPGDDSLCLRTSRPHVAWDAPKAGALGGAPASFPVNETVA
jgi:hypothetical protein